MIEFIFIPDELTQEMSKWIQAYPESNLSISIENIIYRRDMNRQLKKMAKKYDISIFRLMDYYFTPINKTNE